MLIDASPFVRFLTCFFAPTTLKAPTSRSTVAPTRETPAPTLSWTTYTSSPTEQPIVAQTSPPTIAPTLVPTAAPAINPTASCERPYKGSNESDVPCGEREGMRERRGGGGESSSGSLQWRLRLRGDGSIDRVCGKEGARADQGVDMLKQYQNGFETSEEVWYGTNVELRCIDGYFCPCLPICEGLFAHSLQHFHNFTLVCACRSRWMDTPNS